MSARRRGERELCGRVARASLHRRRLRHCSFANWLASRSRSLVYIVFCYIEAYRGKCPIHFFQTPETSRHFFKHLCSIRETEHLALNAVALRAGCSSLLRPCAGDRRFCLCKQLCTQHGCSRSCQADDLWHSRVIHRAPVPVNAGGSQRSAVPGDAGNQSITAGDKGPDISAACGVKSHYRQE